MSSFSNNALDGEIALVTGASRGIGAAIAAALADAGATVVGTATSDAGAQAISDALGAWSPSGWKSTMPTSGSIGPSGRTMLGLRRPGFMRTEPSFM